MKRLFIFIILMTMQSPSFAVQPNEILSNPELEARARSISQNLRCLVCQNQSIDDSDASLAKDLRVIVRERLTAGDTDDQVFQYIVTRYGNFVLLQPPLQSDTYILWAAPFVLLLVALGFAISYLRKQPPLEED